MANLTITASDVADATKGGEVYEKITAPTDEAVTAGQVVRLNTTSGKLTKANGTSAAEALAVGVAVNSANVANVTITAIRRGVVDLGDALDALAIGAIVYLSDTDGTLADSAGTTSKIVGRVIPAFGATTADKLLRVDLD